MKSHLKYFIRSFTFILFTIIIFFSCNKDKLTREAKVETKAVSEITATTAKASGDIIDLGKGITDYGHCWGLAANPTIDGFKTSLGTASKTGSFTSDLQNLEPKKLYYVRAYVMSGDEVFYGTDTQFTSAPPTVPGAPIIGIASAGIAQATISFTAPASNGGASITGYTVTSSPGGFTGMGSASPISVTGLTNGTAYTFRVTATNIYGTSAASSSSNSVTPSSTVPGAPTIGTATKGNAQAVVTFSAPTSNGGSAITGYTVTSSPGNITGTGSASPVTVIGLTNGTAYTFTVTATNINGTGMASSASNSIIPSTIPGAPTIGIATAGNTQATVAFTAPVSNGGSVITGYTVTSSPGGFTGTDSASPITVIGLTSGTAYTFTVTATNANGTGLASSPSNSVTTSNIGSSYQGGIVAYVLQPGDPGYIAGQSHGLIAAPSDQSTGIIWWNINNMATGATATALGTGTGNTNTIVAILGSGTYAAKLCNDLVLNGYSDWYLPSKDELDKLYINKSAIGGFTSNDYWSSSEYHPNYGWAQRFSDGFMYGTGKANPFYVRAVRSF